MVLNGLDHLADAAPWLKGRRLGLITSTSGVTRMLTSGIDAIHAQFPLTALFGPEHGVRGDHDAGATVETYTDPATRLPVYSLYRKDSQHMTPEMLDLVDTVIYDIQDIGARFYNDGLASADKRCFEAARQFYEKSLSFGNPQAAVNLGYIYEYGRLGEEDAEQALELFEQAAFCEHPEALYKLGDMLYWRNIYVADESAADIQAFALYGKAHRLAQGRNEPDWLGSSAFRLGGCFEYGRGCARDYALAQAYYVQAAANFEAALDDGFDYYRGNLEKCHRALQRLGERSDSYAQWRPLPSGAKFDVDGILRIDGDSLVPAGCYRARSGEQLIVGQHDVDEGMRVDRRFEVLRCARMVEFNLAMRGSVENRSTVRITFDELGAALEQELGVMGQREFLQLDPEDAAALRGQLLGFELASWEEAYQPYAAQDDSLEWSVEVLSDVQGFSSKGSGAWPYYLPFLFEELQRFGVANMWVRGH